MQARNDSTRILRIAAWIWIGYLLAMAMMDFMLYTPQAQRAFAQNTPIQQNIPGQQPPLVNPQLPPPQGPRFWPIFLFYASNGLVAYAFLLFTHWKWIQTKLGDAFEKLPMAENDNALDDVDRAILNRIQSDFPITPRPYLSMAEELGLDERDLIARVARLKGCGVIRRIGGNFVPGKLGFVSTLCAARVPEEKVAHFTAVVNRHPGVTHNYRRENSFNVWFTFIAPSMADIDAKLKAIAAETGVTEILNLPATKVFKIRAQFDV